MLNLNLETAILQETLPTWESFLLSKENFRQIYLIDKNISSEYRHVRISCGRILVSIYLLNESSLNNSGSFVDQFLQIKRKWLSNWRIKVAEEIPIRTRQWNQFVIDLNKYKNFPKPQMINQLQVRLMLELLLDELEESQDIEEFTDQIAIIDLKYKYGTTEDGFVWSKDLDSCFPKDKFWFLYRIIDGSRD